MASDESARALQLANSLRIEDVPAKLRCGMCNKLAVDAVKLLCCGTSICEPCSHEIPETCSVCTHSPTSPEECLPDKKLRNTVRAFVRTEEKKRGKPAEPAAATPVQEPTPVLAESETPAPVAEVDSQPDASIPHEAEPVESIQAGKALDASANVAQPDTQPGADHDVGTDAADIEQEVEEEEEDDDDGVVITVERPEQAEQLAENQQQGDEYAEEYGEQGYGHQSGEQQANDYSQGQQGFGNMDSFNPMMGMQNGMGIGMGNFGMAMPNMMGMAGMGGMTGMNLDPSMMFPNGGFGGMGDMSAMMNMGMGGMNGMGAFGGMMNMGGGSGGFFGPGNSGGYNNHHQQFGNQVNAPFHHQRGYYNRGRGGYGRGRGGFYPRGGRGNFNSYNQFSAGQNHMQQQQGQGYQFDNEQQQPAGQERGSPVYDSKDPTGANNKEAGQPDHIGEGDSTNGTAAGATNIAGDQLRAVGEDAAAVATEPGDATASMEVDDASTLHHEQPYAQQAYGHARGGFGFQGGAYGNVTTVGGESEPPPAPPVNAPKGPKAMRQGLPNNGRYSRPQQPPMATAHHADQSKDQDGVGHRDGLRATSRSPSRHEKRRDRERTPIEARESDEAYAERKERERERRKRKEREARDKYDEDTNDVERSDKAKLRSDSVDEHDRRKRRDRHDDRHSSRRDRSRERRKHRDRSRSPDRSRSGRDESSDQSRRKSKHDRGHDESDDYDRDKDRRRSRKHSRRDDEAYEYDSKDHSKLSRSSRDDGRARDGENGRRKATPEPAEDLGIIIKGAALNKKTSLDQSMGPPSGPRSSREERRSSVRDGDSAAATPVEDQYAAEREMAIAARLKKHNASLGKRTSRTEDEVSGRDDRGHRKRARQDTRKHSARFE